MGATAWLPTLIVLLAATVGAVTDVWKFRVYNVLTFPLMLTGLTYHAASGGWSGSCTSLAGLLFGLFILIVPYLLGLMGAGDVKLMAGVGAWMGLETTVLVFVFASLVAGVYALALMLYRGRLGESWGTIKLILYRFAALGVHFGKDDMVESLTMATDRRMRVIPFGAMVPLGIVGALFWLYWSG